MKKSISIFFSVLLLSVLFLPSASFAFSDIRGNWAEATIIKWKEEGRITGYPDGTFQPESGITRAELISMVIPLFGFTESSETSFHDVSQTSWYYDHLGVAVHAGFIHGYPDGSFRPNQNITRQEMAVIITRVLGISSERSELPFRDADDIPDWSREAIAAAYEHGLMSGIGDGKFYGQDVTTRSQAIVLLERAYKLWVKLANVTPHIDDAGVYGPAQGMLHWEGDLTIASPDVVLQNVTVSGDLLLASAIGEGDVSLQRVHVQGETTIAGGGRSSVVATDSTFHSVVIDRPDGPVRFVLEGESEVQSLHIATAALLELQEGTSVGALSVAAPLTVSGNGTIQSAAIHTDDEVSFETAPEQVTRTVPEREADDDEEANGDKDPSKDEEQETLVDEVPEEPKVPEEPSDPGQKPEEPSVPVEDETPQDGDDPAEPSEPLLLLSASANIGGRTVTATMDGNYGRVNATSFDDSDTIGSFSLQASSNVDRIEVSAFGISRTIMLNDGHGSISISDILGTLISPDRVNLSLIRSLVGESTSIGGTLVGFNGERASFEIQIYL